jgi:IS30 family transposase
MSHLKKDNKTSGEKKQHLQYEDRCKIEGLLRIKAKPTEIAELLGKHRTTIEREIKLGTIDRSYDGLDDIYSAKHAQIKREFASSNKGRELKIGKNIEFANRIEELIKQKFSPYAALQFMRNNGENYGVDICEKTLYNYINSGVFREITNKNLTYKAKKKRTYKKVRLAKNNQLGESISKRPESVSTREEFGHWEIDLVVGKQGTKAVFLTLDERKTRKRIVIKLENKTQGAVVSALKRLRKKYKFKTITADNGSEFLDFKSIEKWLKCKVYYAHPYASWERGTNENQNRMIRRFYPKGMDLSGVSQEEIDKMTEWINNYPRKIFGGKSANMMYEQAA